MRNERMTNFTHEQAALVNFIVFNFQDADGYGLTADLAHWAEYEIFTIRQLQLYIIKNDIWELYKSAHGVSPRFMGLWSDDWTMEELNEELERTVRSAEIAFEEEDRRKAEAIEEFEAALQRTIEIGAGDRQTAFRWMTQDYEGQLATQGFIEYDFGVPYGTFAEFFPKQVEAA
jgi:hypothetical protein